MATARGGNAKDQGCAANHFGENGQIGKEAGKPEALKENQLYPEW